NFCKLHKIKLHHTTPKNSNSNSPVERFHSTLAEEIRCLKSEKPNENANSLITYAIIGYNNAIHSATGHILFEVLKGHINSNDPFELSNNRIISNYIQNHKDKVKTLYSTIKEKSQKRKECIINKLNSDRQDPESYKPGNPVYIKTKERNKAKPKFSESKIILDNDKKLITHQGIYHKSNVKNQT
ncbi:rve domain containing protein, partial [Asbolus verrucosus]